MQKDSGAYTPAALTACLNTLGTLVKATGAQYDARLVVVGGLVPRLLMDDRTIDPLFASDTHIGTNDVDLCIELDVPSGDDDFYQRLEQVLKHYKFQRVQRVRQQSTWSWTREDQGVTVIVDLLCNADSVGVAKPGRVALDQRSGQGDQIGAFRLRGAHLALLAPKEIELEVDLLDGGGCSRVKVRVASILAFVVLKSFALNGRIEPKDAYDLVWVLTRWVGGPSRAGRDARSCTGANHADVVDALQILKEEFQTIDASGCASYAHFSMKISAESSADAGMKHRRDANAAIADFLRGWDESAPFMPPAP